MLLMFLEAPDTSDTHKAMLAILSSPIGRLDVEVIQSTNEVDNVNIQVSTVNTPVSTVSTNDNTANISDATVYFQRTGKNITINGSDTAGYDKTNVECFNCHKMGHFARECRSPRNQESKPRNQDSSRNTVNVEDTSSKAMVAIVEAGFDWSYMADDEAPTNMTLMAFSDSEVQNRKTCSNTCLKSFKTLKTQYDNLRIEFNKSEFDLATYKRGLASVEEQLVFYKKNEVMFCDQITVLKRDALSRDSEINALNLQIEKLKKEKESNQIKIDNFENAFKSLDKLIGSQISDNSKTGLGFTSYNAVASPPTGLFAPPTIDLSNSDLEEFQHPEFKGYGPKDSKSVCVDTSNEIKKAPNAPIIEDWVSNSDEDESEVIVLKSENVQHKPEQANQPRKMVQKPVLKNVEKGTGQMEVRPVWNNTMRINHQNFSNYKSNFAPTAVLTKFRIVPIGTARQSSSRAAAPVSTDRPINNAAPKPLVNVAKPRQNALQKSHSLSRRPFRQQPALKSKNLNNKVNTAKVNSVNTAKGNKVTSDVGQHGINVVKSSACWGNPKDALKDEGYFDSGCSRNMTGNISYLTDFKEHDGGTGKLDFEDVYFVKELQFNLFSVLQMCDKKNIVLFTDTECFVQFTWVFFLATKDETSRILKIFITKIENLTLSYPLHFGVKQLMQNRVLVVKPHFKTPYELFKGRSTALSFMRPFGCHVTIHNTLDQLGKFEGKSDEGIFVGYSTLSKAFRVYHTRTRKVEENLHITFLDNKPMIAGGGPDWLFDIDALLESMNYAPVPAGTNSNDFAGKGASFDAGQSSLETGPSQDYILMPLWKESSLFDSSTQDLDGHNKDKHGPSQESECHNQEKPRAKRSIKNVNTAEPSINTANINDSLNINTVSPPVNIATPTYADYPIDPLMPDLEDTGIFDDAYDDRDEDAEADYNN
nr:retrovirus-related Pol polyprotein from transposon TNT 1-94 [Tanacetum cinerariifolium]